MFNYLAAGNSVTSRQARTLFKVKHISTITYNLRNNGVPVYTNRVVNSRGKKVCVYRIGAANKEFLSHLQHEDINAARKTLYRDAIAA